MKYSDLKHKQIKFTWSDWYKVEANAADAHMKIASYIQHMAVNGEIKVIDLKSISEMTNVLRSISNNIRSVERKAAEIHSVSHCDVEILRKEVDEICLTLNQYLYTLQSTAA